MRPTELRVINIFLNCLLKDGEDMSSGIKIKSFIWESVTLDPKWLDKYKDELGSMLDEIPEALMKRSGWKGPGCGCRLRDGTAWACELFLGDHLYTFGVALGRIDPKI